MKNVFELAKENVTARQAAEFYGLGVNQKGMACCPFHNDKNPSMKITAYYFCFGCGEKGDAIDLVAKLFNLSLKDAANKICSDFGLKEIDNKSKSNAKAPPAKKKSDDKALAEIEWHAFIVLSDYYHKLKEWKKLYAPKSMDDEWHPYFEEALDELDHMAYLLDVLLEGDVHDRAFLVSENARRIKSIEKRLRELK